MSVALKFPEIRESADRPGWIPSYITHDWDTNPYAYQTEEELMPAGGLHGKMLTYVAEILRDTLESNGLMLLVDTFMLYRDNNGVKQRIGPDLLLMPFRSSMPSSYDLDIEPPPLAVIEITSPGSHVKDLEKNVSFYTKLGIPSYLVIDAVTPQAKLREEIQLHLWRKRKPRAFKMRPDAEDYIHIPKMNVKIKASGNQLIFKDSLTDEILQDYGQLRKLFRTEQQRAEQEKQRAEHVEDQLMLEREKSECLAAKLRSMGIDPDELMK